MQIKNEAKGDRNCDGTELVWDEERGEYVLRPIANTDQMTIFDADFRCVNDEPGGEEGGEEGQPALEGRCVAALPGPSDTEGDGTEEEVADEAPGGDTEGVDGTEEGEAEDMSEAFNPSEMPFTGGEDDEYGYEEPGEEE